MYFKGLLFRVGEHAIADVPQSGLAGSGPEDKNKKKKKMQEGEEGEEEDLHNIYFALSSNLWMADFSEIRHILHMYILKNWESTYQN